jgi:hypothetical protein
MATTTPPPIAGHTEYDVLDDRMRAGRFTSEGHYFYATDSDAIFHLTATHPESTAPNDTFELLPCTEADPTGSPYPTPDSPDYVEDICQLAGEIELGRLIPLPDYTIVTHGDDAFLSVGVFVLRIPRETLGARLRTWLKYDSDAVAEPATADGTELSGEQVLANATTAIATNSDSAVGVTVAYPNDDPPACLSTPEANPADTTPISSAEDQSITTRFVPVPQFSGWTFDLEPIRAWVEQHLEGRVLNACAGANHLRHTEEVRRNDINTDREADTHLDVAELAAHYPKHSFETIVFDPPWSLYQANMRYEGEHVFSKRTPDDIDGDLSINLEELPVDTPSPGEKQQLGHARLAKESFDYLLEPGGQFVELTFHGTAMPSRLGYQRQERVVFDPLGEAKAVIGSVDQKVRQTLDAFTDT